MHHVDVKEKKNWGVFFDAAGTLIRSRPQEKRGVALFEDVFPALHRFQGPNELGCTFHLGVITNWGARVFTLMNELGLSDYFQTIVCADDVSNPKPHKDIFLFASQAANLQPEECFFVGDSFYDDGVGSCQAGFQGVWLNRRNECPDDASFPIPMVSSLLDFSHLVFKWIRENGT